MDCVICRLNGVFLLVPICPNDRGEVYVWNRAAWALIFFPCPLSTCPNTHSCNNSSQSFIVPPGNQ